MDATAAFLPPHQVLFTEAAIRQLRVLPEGLQARVRAEAQALSHLAYLAPASAGRGGGSTTLLFRELPGHRVLFEVRTEGERLWVVQMALLPAEALRAQG